LITKFTFKALQATCLLQSNTWLSSLRCARGAPLREAFLAARDHALIGHDEDLCCVSVVVGCVAHLAERRSLVVELSPVLRSAYNRRVTTMWVNRPLQVSQLGQLGLSSFWGR